MIQCGADMIKSCSYGSWFWTYKVAKKKRILLGSMSQEGEARLKLYLLLMHLLSVMVLMLPAVMAMWWCTCDPTGWWSMVPPAAAAATTTATGFSSVLPPAKAASAPNFNINLTTPLIIRVTNTKKQGNKSLVGVFYIIIDILGISNFYIL